MALLTLSPLPIPALVNPRLLSLLALAVTGALIAVPVLLAVLRLRGQRARPAHEHRSGDTAPVDVDTKPPEAPEGDEPISPGRRRFFAGLSLAAGALGGLIVGVPVIGFLFAPLRREEPEVWRPVGALDDFPIGTTVKVTILDPAPLQWAGFAAEGAAWVRRESEQRFVAFSGYCTHVGCPVRWLPDANLFMCPCHGGAFYQDGAVAAGPPPAPLTRYMVRVRNRQVEVQAGPIPLPTDNG